MINFYKKNGIFINYKYAKPNQKYINITTTDKSNLKFFFIKFDKIVKKEKIIFKY